jgi:hypothetical protein
MFSNKFYYIKLSFTCIIILGACLYSLITLHSLPPLSEGEAVVCKYRKVLEIGDNYFIYAWGAKKTTVFGDVSGIKIGDRVSFSASLIRDDNLKLNSFHIHKYRNYAIYLSVPPIVVVFWIVVRRLKWTKRGLTLHP